MPNRYLHNGDNPDLSVERQCCVFDTDELGARLHGNARTMRNRKRIQRYVEQTEQLRATDHNFSNLTSMQIMEKSYRNALAAEQHADQVIDRDDFDQISFYRMLIDGDHGHPFLVTHFLVLPMLETNADEEQKKLFLEPVKRHVWPSAYAQTEMAHGSNIDKLETTATYDPLTEEFVLHSPSRSAYKWWPGNVAVSAQVAVVMAMLWTQNKCYGLHPFFLHIRDEKTHEPLPGIIIGHCGPNMGLVANDMGYLGFNNFRAPRKSMLMRYFKITPDGCYIPAAHPRLAYTGMMFARSRMIHDVGVDLAATATIAIRYLCVHRDSITGLDCVIQQYQVLPQLARAFNFCLVGLRVRKLYHDLIRDIENGNFSQMEEMHALTSCLKSVVSWQGNQGADICRHACGANGCLLASGIPQLHARIAAGCSYEGENIVMLLQTARYLMKRAKLMHNGSALVSQNSFASYLFSQSNNNCSTFDLLQTPSQQWHELQLIFEHISRRLTLTAYDRLCSLQKAGDCWEVAWNKNGIAMTKAARAHARTFLTFVFIETCTKETNIALKDVMSDLLQLYLHYELQECRADAIEDGFMSRKQLEMSRTLLKNALQKVRRNAVNISDSFDLPDRYLGSVLGRRDGHIYENLLKSAQNSELNTAPVLPFHHETVGLLMRNAKAYNNKL